MARTYPKEVLGALLACMLLTFHFSQQKFTEDVLQHVWKTQIFIKILGRSLLISHLMLLMHQILLFLLVGPSGKECQTCLKFNQTQNIAGIWLHFYSARVVWPCPSCTFSISYLCLSEANGAQPEHKCAIACWALYGGKAAIPLLCRSK